MKTRTTEKLYHYRDDNENAAASDSREQSSVIQLENDAKCLTHNRLLTYAITVVTVLALLRMRNR